MWVILLIPSTETADLEIYPKQFVAISVRALPSTFVQVGQTLQFESDAANDEEVSCNDFSD
ncbi:hypothetical protein O9992_30410 [Vibrio lentus]|nr:hypothetical protein [Vibrio lentus]